MAQAGEGSNNDLMQRLTNDKLPARRDESRQDRQEPVDPGTQGKEPAVRGKRPDEVIEDGADRRQTQQPASTAKDDPSPLAKRSTLDDDDAGKKTDEVYDVRGRGKLTAKQIAADPSLLDAIIRSANQLPSQVQKTQELLEQFAAAKLKEQAAPAATPEQQVQERQRALAEHQQATLQVIRGYREMAEQEIKFYLDNDLLDPDLADGFPKSVATLFAVLLFHLDLANAGNTTANWTKEWIRAQVNQREALTFAHQAQTQLQTCIDKVAAKEGKLFEALRDKEAQKEFETWLKTDIDPKMEAITPENIERLWIAHNAEKFLEFSNLDKQVTQPTRRAAKTDGTQSTRPGSPEPEPQNKSLLDRMTDRVLQPQE